MVQIGPDWSRLRNFANIAQFCKYCTILKIFCNFQICHNFAHFAQFCKYCIIWPILHIISPYATFAPLHNFANFFTILKILPIFCKYCISMSADVWRPTYGGRHFAGDVWRATYSGRRFALDYPFLKSFQFLQLFLQIFFSLS